GILGSLLIAVTLFIIVSLVLVGMFDYAQYKNNAEPVGWALRMSGHSTVAVIVQAVSVIGMFTALIDRKSTRLNSSHVSISYAFCLWFFLFSLHVALPI